MQSGPCAAMFRLFERTLILAVLLMTLCSWAQAKTNETKRAKVQVSGYGWLGDRKMKQMLMTLEGSELKRGLLDAGTIEDSALILMSQLRKDGYLKPSVALEMQLADGRPMRAAWTNLVEPPLPRPLEIRKVRFRIRTGVLYHFKRLDFEGLTALSEKSARPYFLETGVLLKLKSTRIYTPERLNRGLAALKEQLLRLGYEAATVTAGSLEQNDRTGEVHAGVSVHEGPKSMVRSVRVETSAGKQPATVQLVQTNQPYSTLWQQDFVQQLKATNYHRGYPDTTVAITNLNRTARSSNVVELDLLAEVATGVQAHVGKIEFAGSLHRTRNGFGLVVGEPRGFQVLDQLVCIEGRKSH